MKKTPVFDGHNDTLLNLFLPEHGGRRSFFEESDKGQVDLPRTRKGGLIGGFFAIFTPPPESSPESDGKVKIIRDCQELEWCIENNVLAVVLHFEGAAAIEKECNELGIIIDLAHINERGFWDAARISKD